MISRRGTAIAYFLVGLVILLFFLFAKIHLFNSLEYVDDVFNIVQIAHSPFIGAPLFFYNNAGDESFQHLYLAFILLFAPIVHYFGAKALFVGTTVWLLATWYFVVEAGYRKRELALGSFLLNFALLFFGPITIWLIDDPYHGWHTEILYIPFSILFGLSLYRRHPIYSFILGLGILLTREDGALVMMAVIVAHRIVRDGWRTWLDLRLRRECAIRIAVYLLIFLLQVQLLHHISPTSEVRAQTAISNLISLGISQDGLLRSLTDIFNSFLIVLVAVVALWEIKRSGRVLIAIGVALIPLFPILILSGFAYGELNSIFGLLWPARFTYVWSITLTSIVLATMYSCEGSVPKPRFFEGLRQSLPVSLICFCLELVLITALRLDNPLERFTRVISGGPGDITLSSDTRDTLLKLSSKIPTSVRVITEQRLSLFFDHHDTIAACSVKNSTEIKKPFIYICTKFGAFSPMCPRECEEQILKSSHDLSWSCTLNGLIISGDETLTLPEDIRVNCKTETK